MASLRRHRAATACATRSASCSCARNCVAQWVAAGFAVGLVAAPRATRFVGGIYAAETISDFLQLAYKAAEDLSVAAA